jgi:uncharacterized protein
MTSGPFHSGELAVQRRAGVAGMASRIGNGIHAAVPPAAAAFLAQRSWIVLATADAKGRPWASVVSGPPGFASVLTGIGGETGVRLATHPVEGDPLAANLAISKYVGLLAIDLATRRRMRVNGRLIAGSEAAILLGTDQAYSNCPKYIQRRVEEGAAVSPSAIRATHGTVLTPRQRVWIRGADTFFVGTVNPGEGADASHRGGAPGFVEVAGDRIWWPDYPGNMMFNTLGNIQSSGRAGLLFPDFATGNALLLTGKARLEWSPEDAGPGVERAVELGVEEVVELAGVFPERLKLLDYSPHLPPTAG